MEMDMAVPPLKLSGNLADRHRALNQSVITAYSNHVVLESIVNIEEHTPYDRLFKIDLASQTRNVDYILHSLKSDDMLYVNRALKSLWLLQDEYSNIINPEYLEETLYPQMHFKAVNKMMKWISKNLKGESRNEIFYIYYKEKDFNKAFNFLKECNSEYVLKQSEELIEQLTPKRLKILSQRNVLVTKMFYDELKDNNNFVSKYSIKMTEYFKQLIHVLKLYPDLYLDLIEKYYSSTLDKLSFAASNFIMKNKKQRFFSKSELYTAWFLNTNAIAINLSKDENKELIYKLAKAGYISYWFTYQNVEPLLRRLDNETRNLVKKEIFVDTAIKDRIKDWPYPEPKPLRWRYSEKEFYADDDLIESNKPRRIRVKKGKKHILFSIRDFEPCSRIQQASLSLGHTYIASAKEHTLLNKLFDEYRFVPFGKTLEELSKRIMTESNPQNRMYMLLVLVSKSAGNDEHLEKLLTLIVNKHLNETNKFRTAIVRSLVKKAFVWRMSSELWERLLKYAHGLGLDGNKTDLVCSEGLHSVIIRKAILKEDINTQTQSLFFENFNTMKDYKLNPTEKIIVYEYIKHMLLESAKGEEKPLLQLRKLLQLLKSFNVKLSNCPETKDIIVESIKKDPKHFKPLLEELYKSKDFQKELFYENFAVIRNREMYNYALKYDISVLDLDKLDPLPDEKFFKKLSVYFSDDLTPKYATLLDRMAENTKSHKSVIKIARYLAIVSGKELGKTINKFESGDENAKAFAKTLRANYHLARADISHLNWSDIGANSVAVMAFNCKSSETKDMISKLSKWRPSATIAVRLALRNEPTLTPQILKDVSIHGPVKVLPVGVESLRLKNSKIDYIAAWEAIKDLIPKISELNEKTRKRLIEVITFNLNYIPDKVKASYYETIYNNLKTHFSHETKRWLLAVVVDNNLTELSDVVIDAAQDFFKNQFPIEVRESYDREVDVAAYINIFIRFALSSANAENLDIWFNIIFGPIFKFYKNAQKRTKFELKDNSSDSSDETTNEEILNLELNDNSSDSSDETTNKEILNLELNDNSSDSSDETTNKEILNLLIIHYMFKSLKYNKAFFKTSAEIILPLFDKINDYLKTFLPVEKYFKIHCYLHFTMLYFKSVQQCLKQKPHVFNEDKKNSEGITTLGTVFGKYIASETKQMVDTYFLSIRKPYKKYLSEYIHDHFDSSNLFVKSIIFSILETDIEESYIVAECLYSKMLRCEDKDKEIFKKLECCQNNEVLFYLYEKSA